MRKTALKLLFIFLFSSLFSREPLPLLSLGGGIFYGKHRHTVGLFQAEYKWSDYIWWRVRPQVGLLTPKAHSLFLYGGIGLDLYLAEHLVFTPNFAPGIYIKGKGKDLGCPLEFRSCLELAWEFGRGHRVGAQYFHISNGSLSRRNPGANSWVIFLAFPLTLNCE